MNTQPTPRPALRKAPDAHIHPAAPHHPGALQHAEDTEAPTAPAGTSPVEVPTQPDATQVKDAGGHRLSGPLRGTTSDGLRASARRERHRGRGKPAEKSVDLAVKVPKNLRKRFRATVKAEGRNPDDVVTDLLSAWLNG